MATRTRPGRPLDGAPAAEPPPGVSRGRWRVIRDGAGAVIGAVLGIAPHAMHHLGVLVGTALTSGATGNALFYAFGLLLSLPMLIRLRRRFRTPWAPAAAVLLFSGLFALSAFVIGPAISGADEAPPRPVPTVPTPGPTGGHADHHG